MHGGISALNSRGGRWRELHLKLPTSDNLSSLQIKHELTMEERSNRQLLAITWMSDELVYRLIEYRTSLSFFYLKLLINDLVFCKKLAPVPCFQMKCLTDLLALYLLSAFTH